MVKADQPSAFVADTTASRRSVSANEATREPAALHYTGAEKASKDLLH